MQIRVVQYDPAWPTLFAQEAAAIRKTLPGIVHNIHHIGSTAVPELAAKPIIDILLEVSSLSILDKAESKITALGYEAMGEFGIPSRRYYRKGSLDRTHQIHAFPFGDSNVLRHIAFRDYLSTHPEVLAEYADLKISLARKCMNDSNSYCDGKDLFVKHHESLALAWVSAEQGAAANP